MTLAELEKAKAESLEEIAAAADAAAGPRQPRGFPLGYLRFIRLPGVFTAFADIIAGFFILRFAGFSGERLGSLPHLLAVSACLYLAGMAWNDLFDLEEDAVLRPERPLPAGDVSLTGGYLTAVILTTVGVMLAMAAGRLSFLIAAALALCIFLYDALLKNVPIVGPLCMGSCRGLNLLLGMSGHAYCACYLHEPTVVIPPVALCLYVTAVTAAAAWEHGDADPVPVPTAEPPTEVASDALQAEPPTDPDEGVFQNTLRRQHDMDILLQQNRLAEDAPAIVRPADQYAPMPLGVRISLAAVLATPLLLPFILPGWWTAFPFAALLLALLAGPVRRAWRNGAAKNLRPAVGTALSGICLFDAALLAGFSRHPLTAPEEVGACAVVAAMAVPVFVLRKYIT